VESLHDRVRTERLAKGIDRLLSVHRRVDTVASGHQPLGDIEANTSSATGNEHARHRSNLSGFSVARHAAMVDIPRAAAVACPTRPVGGHSTVQVASTTPFAVVQLSLSILDRGDASSESPEDQPPA